MIVRYLDLAERVRSSAPRCGATRLIAVDGGGGAGKSVFAARLARALGHAPIIHTDDFASWENPHNWWPRLEEQVLGPMARGEPVRYQRWDWVEHRLGDWVDVPDSDVVIIEGVSSSREAVKDRLAMAVWVETPREVRLERGIERDGQAMRAAWDRWMAEEDAFYARDRTPELADLIVDGSPTLPHDPETEFVTLDPARATAEDRR